MRVTVRETLGDPSLDVMNFLNEVVMRYPEAVSFAPGRPAEALFDVEESLGQIGRYAEHRADDDGRQLNGVYADLGQYGKTNGVICDLVARHLERDEEIHVPAESIIVTAGCQEAMLILMMGLFEPGRDVLLVSDPTYIGITGLASIFGVEVRPVPSGDDGLEPDHVATAAAAVRQAGRRPVAVYDIPDFNNPLGTCMPLAARRRFLEVARQQDLLIFEDNPYGRFAYDGDPMPTLKAMDEPTDGDPVVVYLGSFAKTLYPGLRLGYLVADQRLPSADGGGVLLAQELSKIKSLTTVNTSPLLQAVAGGVLQQNGGSLNAVVDAKCAFYKANRDAMLDSLESSMRGAGLAPEDVSWNRPAGGFFLTVNVPFEFDEACLESCAKDYGVICCPMPFFSLSPGRERQIRLSFSYVTTEDIEEGVRRLARFIVDRSAQENRSAQEKASP